MTHSIFQNQKLIQFFLFQLNMAPASDSTSAEGVGANSDGTHEGPTSTLPSKGSPPPYDHALYSSYGTTLLPTSIANGSAATPATTLGVPGTLGAPLGAPGDLQIASFTNPTPATTSASYVGTTSFTNTFLRGILTSIDSKDPVVANAWLDTLLDAIDLLPPDVIKREIVAIAVGKGQLTNNVASRKSACRYVFHVIVYALVYVV